MIYGCDVKRKRNYARNWVSSVEEAFHTREFVGTETFLKLNPSNVDAVSHDEISRVADPLFKMPSIAVIGDFLSIIVEKKCKLKTSPMMYNYEEDNGRCKRSFN